MQVPKKKFKNYILLFAIKALMAHITYSFFVVSLTAQTLLLYRIVMPFGAQKMLIQFYFKIEVTSVINRFDKTYKLLQTPEMIITFSSLYG